MSGVAVCSRILAPVTSGTRVSASHGGRVAKFPYIIGVTGLRIAASVAAFHPKTRGINPCRKQPTQ